MLQHPRIWFWISIGTLIATIVIISISPPLLGIDFTGGSLMELATDDGGNSARIQQAITEATGITNTIQTTQDNSVLIRTEPLTPAEHSKIVAATIGAGLATEELRFESIGPTIGQELRRKSIIAVAVAVVAMLAYLAYTFRQSKGLIAPWKFGVAAIVALIHDLLVVIALFAILGRYTEASVDALFITAMLAIFGYSAHDTIIIFNRFKQERLHRRTDSILDILDSAARLTLIRSLNTSLTTLLVLLTMIIFGGSTIRWFIVALAAGTIVGTYSSLFVAPPILYFLAKRTK